MIILNHHNGDLNAKIDNYVLQAQYDGSIDRIEYWFNSAGNHRKASLVLRSWAKHLHGNAPSGTPYGAYRVTLPNGKRKNITICF